MNVLDTLTEKEFLLLEERHHQKGETIAYEGDISSGVFIVKKGIVEIVSYGLNGKKIVYNKCKENDVFGNNLLFSSSPYYKGNIEVKEDAILIYINKDRLIDLLQTNKDFLKAYLRVQSDFGKELNAKVKLLSLHNAEDRLIFYLEEHQGKVEYKSIVSLSEELGLERETLSRLVHRLEKEGRVKIQDKHLILHD